MTKRKNAHTITELIEAHNPIPTDELPQRLYETAMLYGIEDAKGEELTMIEASPGILIARLRENVRLRAGLPWP